MKQGNTIKKVLIVLFFTVQLVSPATHSLKYFYTGVTPGISFPEFTLVGLLDGIQIMYYDSNIRKMIPKTEWIKKAESDEADYWNKNTQLAHDIQEYFITSLHIAMRRYNHTEGVHTLQKMYGCELHEDGTEKGYEQYGYNGEDFLSLDLDTLTWTAAKPQAVITKQKLDTIGDAKYVKTYLLNECPEWIKKYVGYSRPTLERKASPEVDLFQKDSSSPVVCHATGFFPKAVMITWKKNGEDLNEDIELSETTPNDDGTFQKRSVLTVSPEKLDSDKYTCVIQHGALDKEVVLQVSDRRVLSGGGTVVIFIVVIVAAVVLFAIVGAVIIWKKKPSDFKRVPANPGSSYDTYSDKS